jgi:hypothetical protein
MPVYACYNVPTWPSSFELEVHVFFRRLKTLSFLPSAKNSLAI